MSIEVATPLDTLEDDLFEEESDGTEYNMRELMDQVYANRDIIITVPTEQVSILKQGLITRKAKDNVKLKGSDITTIKDVLSFLTYPHKKGEVVVEGYTDVRVKLGPKKSVQVLEIRVPNDEF